MDANVTEFVYVIRDSGKLVYTNFHFNLVYIFNKLNTNILIFEWNDIEI